MDKLFITILNNTLVASWIILAVIALRFIFEKFIQKIPKWINCILWGFVAIRLVFPFNIESIFSLIPSSKPVPIDIEYAKVPQIDSGISVVNTVINPVLENNFAAEELASVNPIQIVIFFVSYIWVIGVVGLLIYAFISYILLKRQVKDALFVDTGIYRCDAIDSPFILGILRPSIYVPDSLDEEGYLCVIEHEKAHIKRGDFIWKPLGFMILAVYWFNPLCWIAYICLCKDIEYACDEKVTKDMDKDWKAKYCQVLLDCCAQRRLVSACPVAFGEVSVKDRIKSVINYKKPSFWIVCISMITAIIVAVCFMTNPKTEEIDRNSIVGKYVKNIAEEDKMLYTSALSLNEDGTFVYSPSLFSSYMGTGTWEIEKGHIIFSDTGMGDIRKEVFLYKDGNLYYVTGDSASNSMWQLEDGAEYILAPEDFDLLKDTSEADDQNSTDIVEEKDVSTSTDMDSIKIQVDDLNGDAEPDYVIYTGNDGYYNHLSLYLTGEGKVFEHEDVNAIELGTMLCSIDIDHDGTKEIALSMVPRVNSAWLMKYAVLKKSSTGWKEMEIYNPEKGDDSFPIEILHKGDYKNVISCQGLEKTIVFDVESYRDYWEFGADIPENQRQEVLEYYESLRKSITGTPVGCVSDWGMGDIHEMEYKGNECLAALFVIEGYNKFDEWGYFNIFFDYDETGKIRILDIVYDPIKKEFPETKYVNPEGNGNEDDIVLLPLETDEIDLADENMGVSYREHPITHEYAVEGDMFLQYKKRLIGKNPGDEHSTQYIVLTNDENVTWEQVNRSINSDNYEDKIYGTIIIGMKVLE